MDRIGQDRTGQERRVEQEKKEYRGRKEKKEVIIERHKYTGENV